VLRATANLKEAINKLEVSTNRNLIQGCFAGATEPWIGNARNSTVTASSKSGETQGKFIILSREVLQAVATATNREETNGECL